MADTVVVFIYGDLGTGKTLQWARTFWNALAFAPAGELKTLPSAGLTGQYAAMPPRIEYNGWTLYDLVGLLEKIQAELKGQPWPYGAVVFECINYVVSDTVRYIEATTPKASSGRINKFATDAAIKSIMDRFRSIVRSLGTNVAFIAHERAPMYEDRVRKSQGGALFPTRNLAKMIMSWCDLVMRLTTDSLSVDPYAKMCFEVNPMGVEDDYPTKDRHGIARLRKLPPSLREVLLACNLLGYNYQFPRLPGLEWQDIFAEELANGLQAGNDGIVSTMQQSAIAQGLSRIHIEWAISDGYARYQLRKGIKSLNQPPSRGLSLGITGLPGIPSPS